MSMFPETIDPWLVDVFPLEHDGYPEAFEAEDTEDALRAVCGSAARDFPKEFWIEPRHWEERAKENDAAGTWAINYLDRYTNQNPTHECTCHSLVQNAAAARNRARGVRYFGGPKKGHRYPESGKFGSVWLSPLSVYAEANPRQWGGANVRQVLEIACRRGILPDREQPAGYNFRHALTGTSGKGNENQSGGPWVPLSKFPAGWEETAAHFKPLEIVFAESFEQVVCLLLHGVAYSVGRKGHAVPWCRWRWNGGEMEYPDSYNVTRYDSAATARNAWRGGFGILTMTTPDDWAAPGA